MQDNLNDYEDAFLPLIRKRWPGTIAIARITTIRVTWDREGHVLGATANVSLSGSHVGTVDETGFSVRRPYSDAPWTTYRKSTDGMWYIDNSGVGD